MSVVRPSAETHLAAVRSGDRTGIGRVLTLVESTRAEDRRIARTVLAALAPEAGNACRIGITGIPGSGKSTFIEALGSLLTGRGHRVAVLAVDPSSPRNGGSVLGDRTRMTRLAADPAAFIRASPSAGAGGGVTDRTAEAMVVMAAAGYDVILVETVGTGQSETVVADLTDLVLLVTVAGTGDSLQGIKMGVLEVADLIAVNKADAGSAAAAAAAELATALRLFATHRASGPPPVVTCSARTGDGVDEIWSRLHRRYTERSSTGLVESRRREQRLVHMRRTVRSAVLADLAANTAVRDVTETLRSAVESGEILAADAAERVLKAFHSAHEKGSTMYETPSAPLSMPGVVAIDHVGIAVADLDAALALHEGVFGFRRVHDETNLEQGVREVLLQVGPGPGRGRLQLLAPLTPESPIARFLDRRGPGLQQIAYTVTDVEAAAEALRGHGLRLLYESARRGTAESRINFVHPKDAGGVLVELVEPAPSSPQH